MNTKHYIAGAESSNKLVYNAPKAEWIQMRAYNLLQNYSFDVSGDLEEYPEGSIYDMTEI